MGANQLMFDFDCVCEDSEYGYAVTEKRVESKEKKDPASDKYKYVINKRLLRDFLVDASPSARTNIAYMNELKKMIRTIFNRHFARYSHMMQDLMGDAIVAVFNKRGYYEPSRDAYNFLYAIIRNEMGNKILKYTKEHLVESYEGHDTDTVKVDYFDDIPKTVKKYSDALVGDIDGNYSVVKDRDVLDLLIYLKVNERKVKLRHAPEFLDLTQTSIDVLYELLRYNYGGQQRNSCAGEEDSGGDCDEGGEGDYAQDSQHAACH